MYFTFFDVDNQTSINRDTLYSFVVLDLKNPLTVTIPENNGRYFSLDDTLLYAAKSYDQ